MANHKSAKKRSLQSKVKNAANSQYLTRIRTSLNKFNLSVKNSNSEDIIKSLAEVNSIMAKAVKKGITNVVFDRGGYVYHGRVKTLAEAAREAGLKF